MSISAGSPTRSVRSYGDLVVVGGEGHTAGARSATAERYERLEEFARGHWDVTDVSHRWSAQDPVSWDHLPVIGRYHPGSTRLFVASGFHKWGLTSGTFAARILSDLIAGRDNPWAERFNPSRVGARGLPKLAQINAKVALDFFGDRAVPTLTASAARVGPGEGRVVRDGLGKAGVYRGLAAVHTPRLPAALQRRGAKLGLPMSRLPLRRRRRGAGGAGHEPTRAQAPLVPPLPKLRHEGVEIVGKGLGDLPPDERPGEPLYPASRERHPDREVRRVWA